ncbi:odorant receptor Or1-like [Schistocerca piceifrons]|uniref:odorant receptor Or1-like n=1 Tax=Schistocerca piceifrons TaxID=274613 RepID=UPI001F5EB098|nr:odorant receptor Or1-like [Schistocerca piceifrons]
MGSLAGVQAFTVYAGADSRNMEHRRGASGQLLGPEALVLRILGLWRPQQGGGNLPGVLIASVTLASIAVVPAGAALRLCADFPEELEELVLCSYMFIICSGSVIKVALLIGEGGTLHELVRLLSDTRRQYGSGDSSDCIRNRYTRIVDRLHRYFQVMTVPALMCWVASPLLSNGALTAGQQDQRQLPLPLWLPADTHASPTYELLFIIQATCLTITAEATLCLDVFFVRLMMFVAAEIEVLDQSISTMHNFHLKDTAPHDYLYGVRSERSLMATGVCHSTPPVDESSDTASDEMFSKLVKNALHHQAILRSASLLQTAMNVSTFILLFFNMANLCSVMFVTSGLLQRDGNLTKAMKAFLTIPPVLFQTGMYCIFGQITTDQSEKLSHSAFSCGWINCDSHFKRSLLIFMMMVGRPVEITVGKTCQLSKQMLLQVLNGTYVLLNMLFQVRNTE